MLKYRQKQKLNSLTYRSYSLSSKYIEDLHPFNLMPISKKIHLAPSILFSKAPLSKLSDLTSYNSISRQTSQSSHLQNNLDDKFATINRYPDSLDNLKRASYEECTERIYEKQLLSKKFTDETPPLSIVKTPTLQLNKQQSESIQTNPSPTKLKKKAKSYSIHLKAHRQKTLKKKVEQILPIITHQNFLARQEILSQIKCNKKFQDITAESVSIIMNNTRIYAYRGDEIREIASITKVMTCLVSLYLCKKFRINIYTQKVKVSSRAAAIEGTSAFLRYGDLVTIDALLYGLILPSGNDAAVALAEFFHKYMLDKEKKIKIIQQNPQKQKAKGDRLAYSGMFSPFSQGCDLFIREMNRMADHLNLKNTRFNNPHGLSDKYNVSTANDIASLSFHAMFIPQFREYVKTKSYSTQIFNSHKKITRNWVWQNTNKLLSDDECFGVKTGTTPGAGHTMCAYFKKDKLEVITVVLHTKTKEERFSQTRFLYEWCKQQFNQ